MKNYFLHICPFVHLHLLGKCPNAIYSLIFARIWMPMVSMKLSFHCRGFQDYFGTIKIRNNFLYTNNAWSMCPSECQSVCPLYRCQSVCKFIPLHLYSVRLSVCLPNKTEYRFSPSCQQILFL